VCYAASEYTSNCWTADLVSTVTQTNTVLEPLNGVIFIRFFRSDKLDDFARQGKSHVEAGLNTSTVALRVVGGDEKGSLSNLRQ
jgi:hypothetical protein